MNVYRKLHMLIGLLLSLLATCASAQTMDFTGKWAIDMKKTDFERNQVPLWLLPRSFEIKQKKDLITVTSKWYDEQMVQHFYTEYLKPGGLNSELLLADGGKRFVSIKTDYEGKAWVLSVHTIKRGGEPDKDFTEIWTLQSDGKVLTIERKSAQANDYNIVGYYNKR